MLRISSAVERPNPSFGESITGASVLRWLGKGIGLLIGILWGIFFVEHLHEWYIHRPAQGFPPFWVTLAMIAHAGMILGLLALLRWERLGVVLASCSTLAFFLMCIVGAKGPWLVMVNFVPAFFVATSWAVRGALSRK